MGKRWEEFIDDMKYFCNRYEYTGEKNETITFKKWLYACYRGIRGWSPVFKLRMGLQRLFRRDHICDLENWEAASYMSRDILRRLRAFKKSSRNGYPSEFSEESSGWGEEAYAEGIKNGTIIGGGPDRWEVYLDKMIQAFEYVAEIADETPTLKSVNAWYIKHYGLNPYDETNPCNCRKYWKKRIEKEDGSVGHKISNTYVSDEGFVESSFNFNSELLSYIEHDTEVGISIFGTFMRALWD